MKKIKDRFEIFVNNYDHDEASIAMKDIHSHEVAKLMSLLIDKLKLSEKDKYLAMVIAYFHDAGRFPQIIETGSMSDKNYNHAEKSCEIVEVEKIFEELGLDAEEQQIAYAAILNHNKYKIEQGLDKRADFFSKLIRDVDKIDIFRVSYEQKKAKFLESASERVRSEFFLEKGIKHKDIENSSDVVIQRFAFLHDVNFKESFEILNDNKYFDKYIASIKVSSEQEENFENLLIKIKDYFKRRLEC